MIELTSRAFLVASLVAMGNDIPIIIVGTTITTPEAITIVDIAENQLSVPKNEVNCFRTMGIFRIMKKERLI